jgi:nitrogen fixation-related uncharacterized protein
VGILLILTVVIIGLGAFGAASLAWGQDSRDQIPDDHRR